MNLSICTQLPQFYDEKTDDLKYDIYLDHHNNYKLIHETFFNRSKISKKYLLELINIRLNDKYCYKKIKMNYFTT